MKDEESIYGSGEEQSFRTAYLISGFIKKDLTEAENIELDQWVSASMENQKLFEELTDKKNHERFAAWKKGLDVHGAMQRARSKLGMQPNGERKAFSLLPYAAAFAVLIGIIAAVLYLTHRNKMNSAIKPELAADIAPGGNRATLTLSNGLSIMLDTARDGSLAQQGNIIIRKDSGTLDYRTGEPTGGGGSGSNLLSVPEGGQYKIILPDGTKAWLNAASSLKYPVSFTGPVRNVELSGEGYFEVAKDPARPFVVSAGNSSVLVLGTHFNVNAYPEDRMVIISLAEGSVRVNQSTTISAGQQAQVDPSGNITTGRADLEEALAWKDGQFLFKESSIGDVMKQVSRWYGADVSYEGNISEHFNATIPRDVPASQLLHLLEGTGKVHFRIEGKKITVTK